MTATPISRRTQPGPPAIRAADRSLRVVAATGGAREVSVTTHQIVWDDLDDRTVGSIGVRP